MVQFNYRLELDRTGQSRDNFFPGETHELPDKRIRAIAPKNGAFFCDSVKVYEQGSTTPLTLGRDYRYAALHPTATHMLKKEVASLIIITNTAVSKFVSVDYQALGSYYMRSGSQIADLINSPQATDFSLDYLDVIGTPTEIRSYDHIHDIGDAVGFEYLCHMLEYLVQAQVWGDGAVVQALLEKIDRYLSGITDWARTQLDTELVTYLQDFKKQFDKTYLGLDKVVNMRQADAEETRQVADGTFVLLNENENAYVTLKGLIAFKEHVASHLVSATTTFLGQRFGTIVSSKLSAFANLVNGARVLIDSLDNVRAFKAPYDATAYPSIKDTTARWMIHKIINNQQDQGGLIQAVQAKTGETFNGVLTVNTGGVYSVKWVRILGQTEATEMLRQLYAHMDKPNAHGVTAAHLKLGNVRNLPVATLQQVLSRVPLDAYLTQEGALALLAAVQINNYKLETNADGTLKEEQKAEQLQRYQNLFMNCGNCANCAGGNCGCSGNGGKLELKAQLYEPKGRIDVQGFEYGWYCRNGTRVVSVADGLGGIVAREYKEDAYCMAVANDTVARFAIRDRTGSLIGYGYAVSSQRDTNASVEFRNTQGTIICYIYPVPGTKHMTPVHDYKGEVVGYAMDPT